MKGPGDKTLPPAPPRPSTAARVPEIGRGTTKEGVAQVLAQAAEILLPPDDPPGTPPGRTPPAAKAPPAVTSPAPPADFMESPEEPRPAKPYEPAPFLQPPDEAATAVPEVQPPAAAPAPPPRPPLPPERPAPPELPRSPEPPRSAEEPGRALDAPQGEVPVLDPWIRATESLSGADGEAEPAGPVALPASELPVLDPWIAPPVAPAPGPAPAPTTAVPGPAPEPRARPAEAPPAAAPLGSPKAEPGSTSAFAGAARAEPAPARSYSLREVSRLLAACAAVLLLLDADGLLTWVKRMEVGRAQSAWLTLAAPYQRAFDAVGLTRPRRTIAAAAESLAAALGGREDALFAEAWSLVEVAPYLDAMAEQAPQRLGAPGPLAPEAAKAGGAAELKPTVLLVGDSMFAGNLAAAIGKAFGKGSGVKVVSAYQTATGLSRPDVFDWGYVVGPLLERERPRWVVCSFGANDAQGIRAGDKLLPFGEPAWEAVYRQRVRAMMRQVASGGAKVLWLGLPPMREESFDRRVQHLNRLFKLEAKANPGVDFLELSMLFSGPDGGFATFVNDGRRLARVRMEDGVHYAPAGAQSVARWVRDWARERR